MKNALRVQARGAFFFVSIFFCVISLAPVALGASCQFPTLTTGRGESIAVKYVYDGDTLTLKDGRRIRLIGVNTPELGRKGRADEAFAQEAKRVLQNALQDSDADIRLVLGREPLDTYGRQLAYVFVDGQSLSALLLGQGLGWHVVIPPNVRFATCFAAAEKTAQRQHRGLWGRSLAQTIAAKKIKRGGYQRVRGKVRKVSFAKAWWINFDDGFVAVIYPENQQYFNRAEISRWRDQELIVEGWLYSAKYRGQRQWRVKLATPHGVSVL